jgi:SAM-dependent methyltransferase
MIRAARSTAHLDPASSDQAFASLVAGAADRYRRTTITAWQFARGKLLTDPVYRRTLVGEHLPSGGALLDIGCGQGLSLALFSEARRRHEAGEWPAYWAPPPRFDRVIGIESRRGVAALARRALAGEAEIIDRDARAEPLGRPSVVLLFDVLQMMPRHDQESLLANASAHLDRDGVILVREADASGGWRFRAVQLSNHAKAFAFGAWRQRFWFRTRQEWLACFERLGLYATVQPTGEGTPFANVLFRVTKPNRLSA